MMNLETWQILTESLNGTTTLGLGRPQILGGPIGSRYAEDFGKDDDDDDDDKDDDFDGEHLEDDDDDDHKEGDLVGSSHPEEGPDKNFPPDTEEDEHGLPTPDEEMLGADDFNDEEGDDDFLASLGAGAGGNFDHGDEGGDFGGDTDDFLNSLGAHDDTLGAHDHLGGDGGIHGGQGEDMDFLGDIDPNLLGGEFEGGDDLGDALGTHDEEGETHIPGTEEPCPDCNPDGTEHHGDPHCPTCGGEGYVDDLELGPELTGGDDLGGDDLGGDLGDLGGSTDDDFTGGLDDDGGLDDEDAPVHPHDHMRSYMYKGGGKGFVTNAKNLRVISPEKSFMKKMASYMQKHMQKEWAILEGAGAFGTPQTQMVPPGQVTPPQMGAPMAPAMPGVMPGQPNPMAQQQPQMMKKKMVKFMSKKGERSFMAADAPRKSMRKYMGKDCDHMKPKKKHHCKCEGNDFLDSLCSQAKGTVYQKGSSGISEEALFQLADPNAEYAMGYEPQPGQAGFAPQGRVGSIGGGYTRDDFSDIPTLGESRQYRYPTLAEYAAMKARKSANRRR